MHSMNEFHVISVCVGMRVGVSVGTIYIGGKRLGRFMLAYTVFAKSPGKWRL